MNLNNQLTSWFDLLSLRIKNIGAQLMAQENQCCVSREGERRTNQKRYRRMEVPAPVPLVRWSKSSSNTEKKPQSVRLKMHCKLTLICIRHLKDQIRKCKTFSLISSLTYVLQLTQTFQNREFIFLHFIFTSCTHKPLNIKICSNIPGPIYSSLE